MRLVISARSALHRSQSVSVFTALARAALLCLGLGVAALTGCASSAPGDPGAPVNPRMTADMGYPPPPPLDFAGMNMPDLAGVAPCVTAPQSGCAAGNKCSTYDYMTTACAPDGQAARGATCTRTPDSCRAGGLCVEEAAAMPGAPAINACRQFCATDAQCGAGSYCLIPLAGSLRLCTQACDPTTTASCGAGLGCYLFGSEQSDCAVVGKAPLGGACTSFADCQAGLLCSGGKCRTLCKRSLPAGCGAGQMCNIIKDNTFEWPTYGVCCPTAGCQ